MGIINDEIINKLLEGDKMLPVMTRTEAEEVVNLLLNYLPKWKPAAAAYDGDRLPRYDWQLGRIVARDEEGIYYLTMDDLYRLPKE